jgi:hypothetical protein
VHNSLARYCRGDCILIGSALHMWVLGMELLSFQPRRVLDSEIFPRFLENLCTPVILHTRVCMYVNMVEI